LIQLENQLLRRLIRLQATESRLARLVSRHRGLTSQGAVRQIERERQRLARELHTGVGQLLAAIRIQVEIIHRNLPDPEENVRQALDRIATLAGEALDQVRGVSRRLHIPEWHRLPLETALRQLWELSGIPASFAGELRLDPLRKEPAPDIKTLIYRAAQEGISNVMRHARATRVVISLRSREDRVVLSVRDNGAGFETRTLSGPPDVKSGIGLRSLREEAGALGGKLLVRSGARGTTLELSVPVETAS
jgi:two-component system NarL family sensor kinase